MPLAIIAPYSDSSDTTIGGIKIPEGSRILLMMGSANHDEEVFPDGGKFDVMRVNAKKHLGLGLGAHFCMGAPLAKLEMRVILEQLTKRLPDLHLNCLLYTSPSPRDRQKPRMPSSA